MKLVIEKDIIMTQLDDEMAILNVKTGKYYSLKGSGVRMWELLQEHQETDEIFQIIMKEFNVEPGLLRRDLDMLISKLQDANLVIAL